MELDNTVNKIILDRLHITADAIETAQQHAASTAPFGMSKTDVQLLSQIHARLSKKIETFAETFEAGAQ